MGIISIENLNVIFESEGKKTHAIHNFSLDIPSNESLGIVGESGSGKSTLAMAILKLLPSYSKVTGKITYDENNLLDLSEKEFMELRWKEIAVVFQKSMNALSPVHKIGEQLSDVYLLHHSEKIDKKHLKNKIIEILNKVNLQKRVYNLYPHELSGGMMQRVSIALSLLNNPNILILDEATTALDVVTERQILEEIQQLEKELKITRIMITHDMSVVATACENVAVMYSGCLMEFGKVEAIINKPLHPYTKGLLNSFASIDNKGEFLKGIPGSLPDLTENRRGCIFQSRCEFATEICKTTMPENRINDDGRVIACHHVGE